MITFLHFNWITAQGRNMGREMEMTHSAVTLSEITGQHGFYTDR